MKSTGLVGPGTYFKGSSGFQVGSLGHLLVRGTSGFTRKPMAVLMNSGSGNRNLLLF